MNQSRTIGIVVCTLAACLLDAVCGDEPRFKALVPGMSITRLPVELTNVDSLAYGPDGRLFAAGYDGRIHVLTDTDDDGIEDRADLFWAKPGDLLTPVGILATKEGAYVASRGKIALVRDTDGDGTADVSETVVTGWQRESYNGDTRNDAAGVAIDKDGFLYFSLGCQSYNKAWQLDDDGNSRYDPSSERGTILKVSPDRKHREILATGLRFVIGLEFNKHGDLFATDQEGDTWFPGGNPRDEFLHVIPGRHYGFPFRHAKYLPDAIDEPSVVDFAPQHQSTCGFRFNEDRAGRSPVGPASWYGNAIVSGFSRGKLWRVPLARTRAGYVGKQIQIAAFESLLTDVAISPTGEFVVTGHGGRPDWGSGPSGDGYLYKIRVDDEQPQPVVAWSASPVEMKIAFDRPVDVKQFADPRVESGDFVWEGDQHEWIYPGYEVVKAEKAAVRRSLAVSDTRWSDDRRTLTVTTQSQPWRSRYAIRSDAEVSLDLTGVQAKWTARGENSPRWSGWLPHLDWSVVDVFTRGSAEHDKLRELVEQPGQLELISLFQPPGQNVDLRIESSHAFEVQLGEQQMRSHGTGSGGHFVAMNFQGDPQPITEASRGERILLRPSKQVRMNVVVDTGGGPFDLDASFQADFDTHVRPLRTEHFFVPWAPSLRPRQPTAAQRQSDRKIPGDVAKGREVFFGKEANCSSCHRFRGEGANIATDLTVMSQRDPDAVMQDILHPSAAINPDYVSYTILTHDGVALTGLFQSADREQITLVDNAAKTHRVKRSDIEGIRASSVSLMPMGFEKLGNEKLQNLVAFLCAAETENDD